jgi:ParB family chromosome partitioning protein
VVFCSPSAVQIVQIDIAAIKIGKRCRRDMGDLDEVAAEIAKVRLLQPIGMRPDGTLAFGERRLRAAQMLGWRKIPAHKRAKRALLSPE